VQQIGEPTAELSVEVEASPDACWAVVSDVSRTPEWSPVCHRVEWTGDRREPFVGARFRGHNRLNGARWSRECVVTAADPGRVFAFSTLFKGQESTRWRYRFELAGSKTRITEEYQSVMVPAWVRLLRRIPGAMAKTERDTRSNVATSLERLKAIVEA
jgi:polyketide cyclase/dehydrase/lipid transport protein